MSLLAAAFPALRRQVGRAFGASVGVHASVPAELGAADVGLVTALEAAEDAPVGALTLTLRRPSSAALTGSVPAGILVTVGAAELQVAQDARAEANLLSVALSEPLATAIAEGDPATIATSAEFALDDAIEQGHKADPTRIYFTVPSGELLIPLTGAGAFFRPRENTDILIGRPVLPYADPDASDDPSPATTAERVKVAAVVWQIPDLMCVAYGKA